MRYTLLQHYPEIVDELDEATMAEGQRAMSAYAATLHEAGVLISFEILQPSSASTTLSAAGGEVRIQDGPFADTKEQLGGTIVIDVPDLDAALEWARQAPAASWGTIEIRPGHTHVVDGKWVPNG